MLIIHANDPTTSFLKALYEGRDDISGRIDENSTNGAVIRALKSAQRIMMLGHGCESGLFSTPDKDGMFRPLVYSRHAEFLRGKECIGIWCKAKEFAEDYDLEGLFSGMIISEMNEAKLFEIATTEEELKRENDKFALRLRTCLDNYPLSEIPLRMLMLDDVQSPLTTFNYSKLYYYPPYQEG